MTYNEEVKDIYEDLIISESVQEKILDSIYQDYEDFKNLQNIKKIKQWIQKIEKSRYVIPNIEREEAQEKKNIDNSLDWILDKAFIV